jgi:predicted enzyme related to lactoylglutathione lyase
MAAAARHWRYLTMTDGSISWFEIDVPDVARAQQFYGAVLPWTFQGMEGYEGYLIVQVGGLGIGAIQTSDAGDTAGRGVTLYFEVSDLEDALGRVAPAGGTVEQERMEVPGGQWIGTARDPFGHRIGFVTNNAAG